MNKVLKSSTIDNRLITMLDINNMTDEDIREVADELIRVHL